MPNIPDMSECNPGFRPTEYNVLVLPEVVEEKTKGGILLTEMSKETKDVSAIRGLLVDVSPLAFGFDIWPEGAVKPQAGDHVIFAKYGGILVKGADGREYRLMKDKDLMAVIENKAVEIKLVA